MYCGSPLHVPKTIEQSAKASADTASMPLRLYLSAKIPDGMSKIRLNPKRSAVARPTPTAFIPMLPMNSFSMPYQNTRPVRKLLRYILPIQVTICLQA